jgi:hypothetical protein
MKVGRGTFGKGKGTSRRGQGGKRSRSASMIKIQIKITE